MWWAIIQQVLPPLLGQLTNGFLEGRRNSVSVAELQAQVVRLLVDQRLMEIDIEKANLTVLALTRFLANSQRNTFVLYDDDRLELNVRRRGTREDEVGRALEDFYVDIERLTFRRAGIPPAKPQRAETPSPPESWQPKATSASEPLAATPKALSTFFDGFEEEIMRARLGRGGSDE
jgi:hypothetical protein